MRTAMPEATLIAKPNAGLPRMEDTVEAVYEVTPDIMADYALKFAAQHVKMLGGCCGSNPYHITAMKKTLEDFTPPPLERVLAQNLAANGKNGVPQADARQRRNARRRERV
jgi:5-methyltetrahydrofolate--homocysteine methyltransferase